MCPVCGILSRHSGEVTRQTYSMMNVLYDNRASGAWVISDGVLKKWELGDTALLTGAAAGQVSFATREQPPERPTLAPSGNLAVIYEGNLYNSEELRRAVLTPQNSTGTAAEIVACLLEEKYHGDLGTALKQVAPMLDGAYCLTVSDGEQIIVMRDPVGLRPVFYGENSDVMAFASRKAALWKAGLRNVRPLRAGMLASFDNDGIHFDKACPLSETGIEININDLAIAVDRYCAVLKASVEKRFYNLKRVGVLVSGGVDSCLIAKLVSDIARERGIEVIAYTAGVKGSADVEYSEHFAQELGLSHKVRLLSQDDIETYIPEVAAAVEERDMVQIEAGVGVYAAVELAGRDGIKVIFSGQGPDELWGGYTWYPQVIAEEGYEGFQQRMWGDLQRADIETLDRENRIALAHGLEQVFPYVDTEVIKLAMSVSPDLKITSAEDRVGKRPHREAAKKLGLPAPYADRSKDAAQHGTGIHAILDAIARKNGFTPELAAHAGYKSEKVSEEILASSTRYGYLYAAKELWQTPQHVQFFLDSVLYKKDLLNEAERSQVQAFLKRAFR